VEACDGHATHAGDVDDLSYDFPVPPLLYDDRKKTIHCTIPVPIL